MTMTTQSVDTRLLSNFLDAVLFLLSSSVTMVQVSCQYYCWFWSHEIKVSEIRNPKIANVSPSEFCPISGDWGKLGIQVVSQALFDDVVRHFPNPREFPD